MTKELPDTPIMNALELLRLVIERRSSVPILTNVVVKVRDGMLYIIGTDLDVEVAIEVERAGVPDYAVTASHAALHAIAATNGAPGFTPMDGDTRLSILAADARYSLITLPMSDFPHLTTDKAPDHSFRLPAAHLLADLLAVRHGMSTEETRYYLNGVYMHLFPVSAGDDAHLRFAATDWHRLFMVARPVPKGLGKMPGVIIPRKVINVLIAALKRDASDDVTVEVSGGMLHFILPGVTITAKAIDGTYPDYNRVIPTANETRLECVAADLARAAECAGALRSERTQTLTICFSKEGGHSIIANSPENGKLVMPLPGKVTGPLFELVGLNAAYLADCLEPFGEATVTLAMQDPVTPVLFSSGEGEAARLKVVQMPMRV